ncbi:MAG TPA: hypothetical protein VFO18_03470 [Methylomirabilota bacterium]|nr:hypothetical protein [Methylomirabilota bacterium]
MATAVSGRSAQGQGSLLPLACLIAAYLIFSVFFSWVLVNHDYEAEYLALGNLAVRGELNLYQDEMTGQWVPLPFYVYGATQVVFGPSLWPARLLSVALGALVLVLVFVLGRRWGGTLAGTAAGALFCTHGLVLGYFSTVNFSPLVGLLHLAGVYLLFCTDWRRRDLLGMAVFSLLFLVKPHYWPTLPFVLVFVLWRARSLGERAGLTAAALAVPALFFALDWSHRIKIFAYVPVFRNWVAPLGYHSWHSLIEDPSRVWTSDYADIPWETSAGGRAVQMAKSFVFFLKRYAVWVAAFVGLAALRGWQWAGRRGSDALWGPPGVRFSFWLFWYLVAWQFVIVGPYIKQSFAYVGAVAPLLAIVIGWLFSRVWADGGVPRAVRAAAVGGMVLAVIVSPWVHRHHNLPRRVSMARATIPSLDAEARQIAGLIPAGETRVFFIGDPLPIHLAGRRTYLRQFHQHNMVFTSVRDQSRYIRSGMWGDAELEQWLGSDAQYAVLQAKVMQFYRSREPYREILTRMDALLARNFTLVAAVPGLGGDSLLIYRRTRAVADAAPLIERGT